MSSKTDLTLTASPFNPSSIPDEINAFNQKLMEIGATGPKWFEVGAAEYRKMRAEGKTPLPAAVLLDSATKSSIPSRDTGRDIPTRVFKPTNGFPIKGVFMHIHGGGWVLQSEESQDPMLQLFSDQTGVIVVSVGYRLAPEDAFPAAAEDCFDVAEYLIQHAEQECGAPLVFLGGESAGGHLSMLVALHLLQHSDRKFSGFKFKALLLHFGVFDLTMTPSCYLFRKPQVLVLDREIMVHYVDAFLPGATTERLKQPDVSPLYADLEASRGRLPPALFTCGTEDPLLDDTMFMSTRWMMAGGEALVKIVPGGSHGYIFFVNQPESGSGVGLKVTTEYMKERLG